MDKVKISPLTPEDSGWVERFTIEHWGGPTVVAHGTLYRPSGLNGFSALREGDRVGLVTYEGDDRAFEIVTLNSLLPGLGIGTALLSAVMGSAKKSGVHRVWLITTNDNLRALAFYQKRGFELTAVHRGALAVSRALKPEIPLVGMDGIPLRDEIELEYVLGP